MPATITPRPGHPGSVTVTVAHHLTTANLLAVLALWPLIHHAPPYTTAPNLSRPQLDDWITQTLAAHGSDHRNHTNISSREATVHERGQLVEWAMRQLDTHLPELTAAPKRTDAPSGTRAGAPGPHATPAADTAPSPAPGPAADTGPPPATNLPAPDLSRYVEDLAAGYCRAVNDTARKWCLAQAERLAAGNTRPDTDTAFPLRADPPRNAGPHPDPACTADPHADTEPEQ